MDETKENNKDYSLYVLGLKASAKDVAQCYVCAHRWVCGDEGIPPNTDPTKTQEISEECIAAIGERLFPMPQQIITMRDVRAFYARCIVHERLGLAFHPDEDFKSYVDRDGARWYCDEDAELRNNLMEQVFEFLREDIEKIYILGMDLWTEVYAVS